MTHHPLEQECTALRAQVAELTARLAERAPKGAGGTPEESISETRLLRAALRSLSDGVVICDADGRLLHFNPVATSIFGLGLTEAGPSEWTDRYGLYLPDAVTPFPPNDLPLARALRGEKTDAVELFTRTEGRPEGTYAECSARPVRDDAGRLCGAVLVCRDIGERKRWQADREGRLRADEQRIAAEKDKLHMARMLKTLLDHLDVVVWSVDANAVFTFQDGRGLQTVGLTPGQFLGKNILEMYEFSRENIHQALSGVTAHDYTETHGVAWESWYVPILEEAGAVEGVIGMSLNITETRRAKLELEAKLALVERQQEVIRNLETPVIQVWDHVLTLPMVGVVDSRRAARVTEDLLDAVSRTQARFAILDLTGVDIVDTATAGHILDIITAVRLLGAEGIITGIRPNVAQTMVSLGLDMSRVSTLATLRDGLALAMRKLGVHRASAVTSLS